MARVSNDATSYTRRPSPCHASWSIRNLTHVLQTQCDHCPAVPVDQAARVLRIIDAYVNAMASMSQ